MQAGKDSINISRPRSGLIALQVFFSVSLILGCVLFLAGLWLSFHGQWHGIILSFIALLFVVLCSRHYLIPVEVNVSHIVCKLFFTTRLLPIENIKHIDVNTYDTLYYFLKAAEEESIHIKTDGFLFNNICFIRLPKADGVGAFLLQKVAELNSR